MPDKDPGMQEFHIEIFQVPCLKFPTILIVLSWILEELCCGETFILELVTHVNFDYVRVSENSSTIHYSQLEDSISVSRLIKTKAFGL